MQREEPHPPFGIGLLKRAVHEKPGEPRPWIKAGRVVLIDSRQETADIVHAFAGFGRRAERLHQAQRFACRTLEVDRRVRPHQTWHRIGIDYLRHHTNGSHIVVEENAAGRDIHVSWHYTATLRKL